jgi:DNA-directed RNA polymerase sigma subunit (sigma70/sigma32)
MSNPQGTFFPLTEGQVNASLHVLTERQRMVVEQRLGLSGNQPRTLRAIGQDLGVTPERVRQIEAAAARKMRHRYRDYVAGVYRALPMEGR